MAHSDALVGIDVSKRWLDLHVPASREDRRVANAAGHFGELVAWLRSAGVDTAVLEASGGYERDVVEALRGAGLSVRVVDPKRVRYYAKAQGVRAKTDRIDARLIAAFGAAIGAPAGGAREAEDPACTALGSLVGARQDLIAHQTGLTHQAASLPQGPARRALVTAAAALAREIVRLDRQIAAAIARHPPFAALARRLASVPGLGPVTIAAIIAWLPELGRIGRRQIAALVGVAPDDDASGERIGQRYIQGGRRKLRNILYMATLAAATRHNPLLKTAYRRLVGKGKLAKVALVACMRKLLHIINTMVARGEDWKPTLAAGPAVP
jgi:transposase